MAIERVDNWELVIYGSDLSPAGPATGRLKIEDSHIRAALIREMGTDSPVTKPVSVGIRDKPYITIDEYIAPYYRASNNLNVMRASTRAGLQWGFTGFEWPLPVDSEIEITGLESDRRIYLRGSLYKNVLSTDAPINRYLLSRSVEHQYKQLRPLYYKDTEIPVGFAPNKQYVLDTSGAAPALVAWNPQDPRYTIAPTANIYYNIKNTIQVLWPDEHALPQDVEFRIKHDRIDVGAQPRLDHMFLPPGDGVTRIVEETINFTSISECEAMWTPLANVTAAHGDGNNKHEGTYAAMLTVEASFTTGLVGYEALASPVDISAYSKVGFWIKSSLAKDEGVFELYLCETADGTDPVEIIKVPRLEAGEWTYVVGTLRRSGNDNAIASVGLSATEDPIEPVICIDDIRPLPNKLIHNPMEGTVMLGTVTGGAGVVINVLNYATGEITFGYTTLPTSALLTYYSLRSGGGRDIFSLRSVNAAYHTVRYPHKQSYVFLNKGGGTPVADANMDLYTLAEYRQDIPAEQQIPASVINAASPLLV